MNPTEQLVPGQTQASPIPGLTYLPNYIEQAQQEQQVTLIDQQPWIHDLQRRVQHYGYRYDYKARQVLFGMESMYLGPLPDWLMDLAERLHTEKWFPVRADQVIVNEYQPGQGISKHVDCVPCFDNVIASLTLGSSCVMEFAHAKTKIKHPQLLEPCSLVILKDEARYDWTHAIPARKADTINGQTRQRARRLSLTFRKVLLART